MSRVGSTHESGARLTSYKTEIYQPWKDQPVTTVSDVSFLKDNLKRKLIWNFKK